jgi:hypothetical protein
MFSVPIYPSIGSSIKEAISSFSGAPDRRKLVVTCYSVEWWVTNICNCVHGYRDREGLERLTMVADCAVSALTYE